MSRWRLIAFGLCIFALALLATAPATLIDSQLAQRTQGALRLAAARGTVWSGTGQLELRAADRRTGIAKSLAWRFLPTGLMRGKLEYEVALGDAAKPFRVALSPSRVDVVGADITLPAAVLAVAEPRLAPLELTGDVDLHVPRISLERRDVRGNATVVWRRAGSALTPVSPLGDYELKLEGAGSAVRGALRTLQGPLQLNGEGSWNGQGNPVLLATARVPPQYQQQLSPLLRLIAVERGDGSFALQLK